MSHLRNATKKWTIETYMKTIRLIISTERKNAVRNNYKEYLYLGILYWIVFTMDPYDFSFVSPIKDFPNQEFIKCMTQHNSSMDFFDFCMDEHWQKEREQGMDSLIPVTITLCVFGTLGVIGNLAVLCVYGFKSQIQVAMYFVITLALVDFLTCALVIPGQLCKLWFVKFPSDAACKLLDTARSALIPISSLLLLGIAIERYMLICRPLNRVMLRKKHILAMITSIIVLGITLGIPNGLATTNIIEVYGEMRSIGACRQIYERPISLRSFTIYWHFITGFYVLMALLLILLYALILHQVLKSEQSWVKRQRISTTNTWARPYSIHLNDPSTSNTDGLSHEHFAERKLPNNRLIHTCNSKSCNVPQNNIEHPVKDNRSQSLPLTLVPREACSSNRLFTSHGGEITGTNGKVLHASDLCFMTGNMTYLSVKPTVCPPSGGVKSQSAPVSPAILQAANFSDVSTIHTNPNATLPRTSSPAPQMSLLPLNMMNVESSQVNINIQTFPNIDTKSLTCNGCSIPDLPPEPPYKITPIQPLNTAKQDSFVKPPSPQHQSLMQCQAHTVHSTRVHPLLLPPPKSRPRVTSRHDSSLGTAPHVQTAMVMFLVSITFILSYLPFFLSRYSIIKSESNTAYLAIFYLYYLNNAINPIIYGVMNRRFRASVKEYATQKKCCVKVRNYFGMYGFKANHCCGLCRNKK